MTDTVAMQTQTGTTETGAAGPGLTGTDAAGDGTAESGLPMEAEAIGGRHSPLRRCIVTRTVQARDVQVRFVIAPDGRVVPDVGESLPGRGLWVTADRAVLGRAVARNAFAKAARRPVRVPGDLVEQVTAQLERRCLDQIGLARRAGQAVAGFEKVRDALRSGRVGGAGKVAVLLAACDGAADGRAKLRALAGDRAVIALFDAASLGAAFGRDLTVHAALAAGGLADRLIVDARRLEGLRPGGLRPGGLRPGGADVDGAQEFRDRPSADRTPD